MRMLVPAVRRHLQSAIAPGTPLATSARLRMRGQRKLGGWLPFRAEQVLAPHHGFIFRFQTHRAGTGCTVTIITHHPARAGAVS